MSCSVLYYSALCCDFLCSYSCRNISTVTAVIFN
nr:MAG TPA: hypothetical protein [Caudoviricetes sp.]